MSTWAKERYYCSECNVKFEVSHPQHQYPGEGCPSCGELPEDYETLETWERDSRGRKSNHKYFNRG
jgi:hypothetical protein